MSSHLACTSSCDHSDAFNRHAKYTVPLALILSYVFRPLHSPLDSYKIVFLVAIAVVYTIPWDSYLIRSHVWSYPQRAVLGPTLFDIPIEELFFFFIQTYITSLLYLLLAKPVFHPAHVHGRLESKRVKRVRRVGMLAIVAVFAIAFTDSPSRRRRHVSGIDLPLGDAGLSAALVSIWLPCIHVGS